MKKSLIFCIALMVVFCLAHAGVAEDVVVVDVIPTDPPVVVEVEKPIYKITWLDADGELFLEEEIQEGQPIMQPTSAPSLDGHEFIGWVDADAAGAQGDEPFVFGSPAEKDTVLLPLFIEIIVPEEEPTIEEKKAPDVGVPGLPPPTVEENFLAKREEKLGGMDVLIIDESLLGNELPEEAPEPLALGINVFSTHKACMQAGDTVELWAELVGFYESDATLQWQYAERGSEWVDVPGATGLTHSFAVTGETINYGWRLVATSING